jgi:Spy/CpxP family protein refolding chaperone
MKYVFYTSLVCGAFISMAQAQQTQPTAPGGPPMQLRMTNMAPPGMTNRPPFMRDRTEILARMLNLTEEQKAKVKPIVEEETKQMEQIRLKTQEKLKPILTPEQYERFTRMGGGPGGMGMMPPPRSGPMGGPPNVQSTPPPGATQTAPPSK